MTVSVLSQVRESDCTPSSMNRRAGRSGDEVNTKGVWLGLPTIFELTVDKMKPSSPEKSIQQGVQRSHESRSATNRRTTRTGDARPVSRSLGVAAAARDRGVGRTASLQSSERRLLARSGLTPGTGPSTMRSRARICGSSSHSSGCSA